jgi:hypothetical protein
MKTPKELAEEYVHAWWGPREDNMTLATRQSFLAGYQAAKDQLIQELESVVKRKRYLKDEHWFSFEEIKDYLG